MVKEKDRIRGFRFDDATNSCGMAYHPEMARLEGADGEVLHVGRMGDTGDGTYGGLLAGKRIELPPGGTRCHPDTQYLTAQFRIPGRNTWQAFDYPLAEYLQLLREERISGLLDKEETT